MIITEIAEPKSKQILAENWQILSEIAQELDRLILESNLTQSEIIKIFKDAEELAMSDENKSKNATLLGKVGNGGKKLGKAAVNGLRAFESDDHIIRTVSESKAHSDITLAILKEDEIYEKGMWDDIKNKAKNVTKNLGNKITYDKLHKEWSKHGQPTAEDDIRALLYLSGLSKENIDQLISSATSDDSDSDDSSSTDGDNGNDSKESNASSEPAGEKNITSEIQTKLNVLMTKVANGQEKEAADSLIAILKAMKTLEDAGVSQDALNANWQAIMTQVVPNSNASEDLTNQVGAKVKGKVSNHANNGDTTDASDIKLDKPPSNVKEMMAGYKAWLIKRKKSNPANADAKVDNNRDDLKTFGVYLKELGDAQQIDLNRLSEIANKIGGYNPGTTITSGINDEVMDKALEQYFQQK